VWPGIKAGHGVELDSVKVAKAQVFVGQALSALALRKQASNASAPEPAAASRAASSTLLMVPTLECASVEAVDSFGPATHAYSFWEGIPQEGRCAFGRLFAASTSMKVRVACEQAPQVLKTGWKGSPQ
jgi:hypothetical protein